MIPQMVTNETVTVIPQNGISFPQADKPQAQVEQDLLKKHLKSEVKVIAAIQILCGVMVLSLGIILACVPHSPHFTPVVSVLLKAAFPFIGSLCFIIAGILTLITEKISTKPLIHSSLAMNMLSCPLALICIIILAVKIAALELAFQGCEMNYTSRPTQPYYYYHDSNNRDCHIARIALTGAMCVMLVCTMVELGLAVLAAVLWRKEAQYDFSGNVIFKNTNKFSMSPNSLSNPGFEELLIPQ